MSKTPKPYRTTGREVKTFKTSGGNRTERAFAGKSAKKLAKWAVFGESCSEKENWREGKFVCKNRNEFLKIEMDVLKIISK